jgi:arginase
MTNTIDVNLYSYGNGAGNYDCEKGADKIKNALEETPGAQRYHWKSRLSVDNRNQQRAALNDLVRLAEMLAKNVSDSVAQNHLFITLGGDHTAAIGTWSGAASAIKGDLGLIWFDAHMDSHTFETTPSNNIHGMPLAVLLGHGESRLTHLISDKPKLKPEHVVLIGIRSFESGEAALLKKLGVTIFYMDDVKKLGMEKVIASAVEIVSKNTAGFGISIDLDGFDPVDAPGVGTPEADGVDAAEFLTYFSMIARHPKLIGADIVEFNPVLDKEQKTEKLAVELIEMMGASR